MAAPASAGSSAVPRSRISPPSNSTASVTNAVPLISRDTSATRAVSPAASARAMRSASARVPSASASSTSTPICGASAATSSSSSAVVASRAARTSGSTTRPAMRDPRVPGETRPACASCQTAAVQKCNSSSVAVSASKSR